jgi:hypothetical protein
VESRQTRAIFKLYVTEYDTGRIDRFQRHSVLVTGETGPPESTWGGIGSGDGLFNHPSAIAVDGLGHVFVADSGNNRIQVFYADGTYIGQWGTDGSGSGQFDQPLGIAADASGRVYVSDTGNNRIEQFQVTLPPTPAGCGSTITTNVHLTADLGPCPGTGLVVAGNNLTIDLGGHAIVGRGVGYGIRVTGSGVTIMNGSVQGFTIGMTIAPNLTLHGVRITQNSDIAISVSGRPFGPGYVGNSATISNSSIDHNGTKFEDELSSAPNGSVAVDNSSIFSNGSAGIFTGIEDYAANGISKFVDNKVYDNGSGISFGGSSLGSSGGADIHGNEFRSNNGNAISTIGACQNIVGNTFIGNAGAAVAYSDIFYPEYVQCVITDNTMSDNNYGVKAIDPFGLLYGTIARNTITSNRTAGIYFDGRSPSNTLTIASNTVDSNGLSHPGDPVLDSSGATVNDGIHVRTGTNIIVSSNATRGNADYGIEAVGATDGGDNIAFVKVAALPSRRVSSVLQRLEGLVDKRRRPDERLEHADGSVLGRRRLLPVPDGCSYQAQPVHSTGTSAASHAASPFGLAWTSISLLGTEGELNPRFVSSRHVPPRNNDTEPFVGGQHPEGAKHGSVRHDLSC